MGSVTEGWHPSTTSRDVVVVVYTPIEHRQSCGQFVLVVLECQIVGECRNIIGTLFTPLHS